MTSSVLRIHPDDNLVVALRAFSRGEAIEFEGGTLTLADDVPAKHQIATGALEPGDRITLHGLTVGEVVRAIPLGGRVTTENVIHKTGEVEVKASDYTWEKPDTGKWDGVTFNGYHRSDGRVGTANYWVVAPLVFCENRNMGALREAFLDELGYRKFGKYQNHVRYLVDHLGEDGDGIPVSLETIAMESQMRDRVFPNVDGIKFLFHTLGCGGMDLDAEMLCRLLATYVNHPNVAGATILSLGCQKAQIDLFKESLDRVNPNFDKPLSILEQQGHGTEEQFMVSAMNEMFSGLVEANKTKREPASLDNLTIGLECGGSDGFSGISANPCMGHMSDLLVAMGGSVILAEFPELCGVEQQLINRCVDESSAKRFVELMDAYYERAMKFGEGFESNPSPGNVRDGLVTDAIKSAGAAKKGGTSPIVDVQDYPGDCRKKGLNLLCTPGGDVESTTGLAGAGANLIVFSTGLGTPTGNPITPVVKISSNTALAERMGDIIDFDAGPIVEGKTSIEAAGEELLELCIRVASGEQQCHADRLGQEDFIPWKRGMSL